MDHIATENQLHEVIQFYQTNCLELANILIFLQYQRDKNQKRLEQLPDPKDLNLELFLRNNIKDLNLIKHLFNVQFGNCIRESWDTIPIGIKDLLNTIPEIIKPYESDGYKTFEYLLQETRNGTNTLPSYLFRLHQNKNGETHEWLHDLKESTDENEKRIVFENSLTNLYIVRDIAIHILLQNLEFKSYIETKYIPFLKQNGKLDVLNRFLNLPFVSEVFGDQKPETVGNVPYQETLIVKNPKKQVLPLLQRQTKSKVEDEDKDDEDDEDDEKDVTPQLKEDVKPLQQNDFFSTLSKPPPTNQDTQELAKAINSQQPDKRSYFQRLLPWTATKKEKGATKKEKGGRNTKKKKSIQKTKKVGNKKKSTRLKKKVRK